VVALLAVVFLLAPVAELVVILRVSGEIGILNTLALMIVVGAVGAWLVKREGVGLLRRIQRQVERGEMPTNELIDGGLILFAGALMITPGFLSDLLGVLLLVPPTRAVVRTVLRRRFAGRMVTATTFTRSDLFGTGDDDVWDAEAWDVPPRTPPELS
jgi:UPF0716 protein FxsA